MNILKINEAFSLRKVLILTDPATQMNADLQPCIRHKSYVGPGNVKSWLMNSVADPASIVFGPLDPGWKKSGSKKSGSGIRNKHPASYFRELSINFWIKNPFF
jgi:hypothetical protein